MASFQNLHNGKYKLYVENGYKDNGKRDRPTRVIEAKSDRAAQKALDAFIVEVATRKKIDIKNIGFEKLVNDWWEMHVKKLHLRTQSTYESALRNGVMDYFKKMKVPKVKAYHIVKFFSEEEKAGRRMFADKYTVLSSIFSFAVKLDIIEYSPMHKINRKDIPKAISRNRPRKFYNSEQMKELNVALNSAVKMRQKIKMEIKLGALVGLREAEIAGIRKDKINFVNNAIYIDRQLIWNKYEHRFVLAPLKNEKPRIVYVPEKFMQGEFKNFVVWHNKTEKKCGKVWYKFIDPDFSDDPQQLLFTTGTGKPTHPDSVRAAWNEFRKRAGLPELNFHGLRHSCLSFMMNHGAPVNDVKEQAGHSSAKITTDTYGHTEDSGRAAAADMLNDIL